MHKLTLGHWILISALLLAGLTAYMYFDYQKSANERAEKADVEKQIINSEERSKKKMQAELGSKSITECYGKADDLYGRKMEHYLSNNPNPYGDDIDGWLEYSNNHAEYSELSSSFYEFRDRCDKAFL